MVAADDDWVLVHDAARPCISPAMLDALFEELAKDPVGGILAVPVADCVFLMIERVRRGHSPYDPDRQHLHHILQATFGKWPSLVVYLGAVALCAFGACVNGWAAWAAIAASQI